MIPVEKCLEIFGRTEREVRNQFYVLSFLGKTIYVHNKVYPFFLKVQEDVLNTDKHRDYIITRIDSFNWRFQRGKEKEKILSKHSFAIAIDMNPDSNPFGLPLRTDMPSWMVLCFKRNGFLWGGDWQTKPDPMHYEFNNLSLIGIK